MTKNEIIEKYGEEEYQRILERNRKYNQQHKEKCNQYDKQYYQQHKEQKKQYYQQHKEENRQYYQQHKEEKNQYQKQYRKQHREEIRQYSKQYKKQHREEIKQWCRNNRHMFAFCIPEQIEQIENYELAKESNFDGWNIHHRLETHNSDGEKRLVNLSRAELIALDMYYNRPANELVFLTKSEHMKLHRK